MDNNTTYTYIGGEITFGSGVINRGFGIDSSLVRYEENTSTMEVITNLIKGVYLNSNDSHIIIKKDESDKTGVKFELNLSDILNLIETLTARVDALESNKYVEIGTVSLQGVRCEDPNFISDSNVKLNTPITFRYIDGYSIPDSINISNCEYKWNKSDSASATLTITKETGVISVSINGVENLPESVSITQKNGTTSLDDCAFSGTTGYQEFKIVPYHPQGLLTKNSKIVFKYIDDSLKVLNTSNNELNINEPYASSPVFTVKGKGINANAAIRITTEKNQNKSDELTVSVNEGSITGVSISPENHKFNANGSSQTFTATLSHNMFTEPDKSSGFKWTIGGTDAGMFSGSSTSNSISITASKNTDTVNNKSATLSVSYGDVSDVVNLTINKQSVSYYWYVGSMAEADALNPTTLGNIVNGKNATSSTTGISTVTIPNDTANEVIVFVYPEIWGRPNITDTNGYGTGDMYYKDEGFELPTGYNATVWSGDSSIKGETLKITWSK